MFTPYYRTYFDETVALARSICIKETLTPAAQNEHLAASGYPVGLRKETWKYYLNIAGEYHPTDRPIYVTSTDTQERIFFDKRVLADHPLTRQEYGPGGPYYRELCRRYPEHVELIDRIILPADMQTAIAADSWTIVAYDERYVGEGETQLMERIQDWIRAHATRWHITSFGVTHGLYPASMLAVLYQHLVPAIINIRAELSRTAQAADFHIWAYLGSRLRLDRFKEYLDHRQSMYLYRNIDYIQTHIGKESTMRSLLENITRPTNLYAYRYDITQSDNELIENRVSTPLALVSPYEAPDAETDQDKRKPVDVALSLTKDLAIYNTEDLDTDQRQLRHEASTKIIDTLPTGLVEMRLEPPPNEILYPPDAIRVGLWFKLAAQGRYQTKYEIAIGEIGSVVLTPYEACQLLFFCAFMEKGLMPEAIGNIRLPHLPLYERPSLPEVNSHLSDYLLKRNYGEAFLSNWHPLSAIEDSEALIEMADRVSKSMYQNRVLSKQPGYAIDQSIMADVHQQFYPCTIEHYGDLTFEDFALQIELPISRMDTDDYAELGKALLREVGGVDLDDLGISRRHRAMVDILRLLTSYGILFVDGEHLLSDAWIDLDGIKPVDNKFLVENHQPLPIGLDTFNQGNAQTNLSTDVHITPEYRLTGLYDRHSSINIGLDLDHHSDHHHHRTVSTIGVMPGQATTIIE